MYFYGRVLHSYLGCDYSEGCVLGRLFHLPVSTIKKLNEIIAHFIWSDMWQKHKYHLTKLEHISMAKRLGGWGILNLKRLGHALLLESLWHGIFGVGIWSQIINHKYLKDIDFKFWMRRGCIGCNSGSTVWCIVTKISHPFLSLLSWRLGTGHHITIGWDNI